MGKIDLYDMATPEIVRMLGARFRDYRMRQLMTQREVAERSNVTVTTIHKFESGVASNINLGTVITLLRAIDMLDEINNFLPQLPPSPYLLNRKDHPKQRIRKPLKK